MNKTCCQGMLSPNIKIDRMEVQERKTFVMAGMENQREAW